MNFVIYEKEKLFAAPGSLKLKPAKFTDIMKFMRYIPDKFMIDFWADWVARQSIAQRGENDIVDDSDID